MRPTNLQTHGGGVTLPMKSNGTVLAFEVDLEDDIDFGGLNLDEYTGEKQASELELDSIGAQKSAEECMYCL